MNATPRVALLPLVIIWLGIGILSKVGIIFLGSVFPMLINTRDGVKTTPANLLCAARSFGASEWMIFKTVVLPSTIPFILTGLRLGLGRGIVGVMVGELYAATAGIGFMMLTVSATGLVVGAAVTERQRIAGELHARTTYLNALTANDRLSLTDQLLRQAQLSELHAGGTRADPARWASYFSVERN